MPRSSIDPLDVDALTDALRRVLHDPALAAARARGLAQAARFSWARAAEETLAVYRRLTGESSAHYILDAAAATPHLPGVGHYVHRPGPRPRAAAGSRRTADHHLRSSSFPCTMSAVGHRSQTITLSVSPFSLRQQSAIAALAAPASNNPSEDEQSSFQTRFKLPVSAAASPT